MIKLFLNLITLACLGILGVVIFLTLSTNSALFGGYRLFVIQSGSMEPAIMTGDLVAIKELSNYYKGDVVTFRGDEGIIVTHRIFSQQKDSQEKLFITKGDANRSEDNALISPKQILGKVVFIVPKVGYLAGFAKSLPGLILLIFVPALIIIIDEILGLFKHDRHKN